GADSGDGSAVDTGPAASVDNGGGANASPGPYDPFNVGDPSGNGNGNGQAVGKPCAGCVGNADDKNPPGQNPNGSDHNKGYECDANHGVGRTNPAHSGCPSTPATTIPDDCVKHPHKKGCSTTTTVPKETTTTVAG